MKMNLDSTIKNIKGEAFKENGKDVILKNVIVDCILIDDPSEKLTGVEKMAKYSLAKKINSNSGEIDLSVEEIVKIKEYVAKFQQTAVVGPVFELLEG